MADAHLPGTIFVVDASGNTQPVLRVLNEPLTLTTLQESITLTNDEILALTSTHLNIVPAPGENQIVIPTEVYSLSNTLNGAYSNFLGSGLGRIGWGADHANFAEIANDGGSLYASLASPLHRLFVLDIRGDALSSTILDIVNTPVSFEFDYGSAALQGGDPSNFLTLTVTYQLISL